MLIPITDDKFGALFKMVKEDSLGTGVTVLILVAYDCDALCACHIITACLKLEWVKYSVMGVASYDHLDSIYRREMKANPDYKSVFLINCGGNIDLFNLFDLDESPKHVYVIDTHRPYNRSNVQNMQHIFLLDDGTGEAAAPRENRHPVIPRRNRRVETSTDDFQNDDDLEDEEDEYYSDEDEDEEDPYHCPSFYGFTAAYALATQISFNTDDMLWLAIVGFTDQFVHQKIGYDRYLEDYKHFKEEIVDQNTEQDVEFQSQGRITEGTISEQVEYKFFLHRFWNLYDSMQYSPFIFIRLHLWKSHGLKRLEELFARMAIPSSEYLKPYQSLGVAERVRVVEGIEKYSHQFDLEGVTFPSFVRKTGLVYSATDVVHSITALLEGGNKKQDSQASTTVPLSRLSQRELQEREQSSQPQRKPRDTQTQTQRETEEEQQEDNERAENALKLVPPSEHFWRAYDALTNSERGADLFVEGTKIAKDVQMEIVKQVWQERDILLTTKAKEVIQKQEVSKNSHFMSLLLSESSHPEYFSQPLILSQLAHFIVDTLIERGEVRKPKPFVIAALNEATKTYLVIGIPGIHSREPVEKNPIGASFARAARDTHSSYVSQPFETSVASIHQDDLTRFWDYLRCGFEDM